MGEPRCLEQSMISSVLSLWVCLGLFLFKTVFVWMSLFFEPFDLGSLVMFLLEEAPPNICWYFLFFYCHKFCVWRSLFQSLFFDPLALACVRDVSFRKVVPMLLLVMGEPWCIEQSNISSFLNLWVCCGLLLSVTVFIWLRLFFDPFDFRCLRDVPIWKRLFRSSSQEWVNPGAPNSQWLTAFWIL